MPTRKKVIRLAIVTAMLFALIVPFGSTPASALTSVGTSLTCEPGGNNCVSGTAYAVNAGQSDLGGAIEFQCVITAPGASATAVTSCTAGPYAAPRLSLSGPAVTTVGAGTVSSTGRYTICWEGSGTFILGGRTVFTSGCSIINIGIEPIAQG